MILDLSAPLRHHSLGFSNKLVNVATALRVRAVAVDNGKINARRRNESVNTYKLLST